MTGETVVYKNDLNLVPLRKFTSTEINLFFAMCNKLKEKETNTLHLSFDELKELSNYSPKTRNINRFVKDLDDVYKKMLELTIRYEDDEVIERFILFNHYRIHKKDQYLEISTSPNLKHILNSITSNFTKFELKEMTNLKSTYSKNMFRILKQYKHTGYMKIKIDDFRERLDIPKSYRMTDINKNVLKPIVTELNAIFNNLHINKIKAKKGRKIEWLEFIFDPEKRIHNKRQPQMTNVGKQRQYINREKTPEWLNEGRLGQSQEIHNEDSKLRQDREAFQRQLEEKWEE
ncbi:MULTISPECIES: replication initiation protein [Bacillati]|jgi:plasmid replication initiation protein|uniref:RepB family plasmid replication initiator protein n=2 Tax=Staphylococcus epidermidis TaxID=1282 RepID=A0A8B5RVB7_STAEP|nr:RepB family plasmid replication initiator protein [Staphylococcus epidermidis]ECO3476114.1 RepB family plasmid replication initiator protein [Campylobacter jejuni]ETJ05990.1 MAG: Initiator RepB protein [Streptococcus parasanguinis DORA_23_24]PCH17798.1 RepB family plasmid replication initiator protein [Campylobacter sp. 114]GHM75579.1 replication initiation protein [Bifidobacterium longum subsp. longum]KAB1896342.1 RepB family plasmid replication initiator protein [Staphylococcus epidermidi